MSTYIDFKALRQSLDAEAIIKHYGLKVARRNGDQFTVYCPWHEDRRPSMGINASKRAFKCFACDSGGNLLDLVTRMEGHDPDMPEGIRAGALAATALFGDGHVATSRDMATARLTKRAEVNVETGAVTNEAIGEPYNDTPNAPLTFELKLSPHHRTLRERGFKPATYETFGIGLCKRGLMAGRLCFPLRDPDGTLVGYAGRWAEAELPGNKPRYLLPKAFNKSRILWNWDRIRVWEPKHIVIVEGFWSVLRLDEAGIPAVATLGHQLFDPQIDMLISDGVEQVTVIYDGDDPGRTGTDEACAALAKHLFVRSISLADGIKPDTMPKALLVDLPRFE